MKIKEIIEIIEIIEIKEIKDTIAYKTRQGGTKPYMQHLNLDRIAVSRMDNSPTMAGSFLSDHSA